MFVGEAPGRQESLTGQPFVGKPGKFLTRLLKSIAIKRENVYITSPIKYYPGNRKPKDSEIAHGRIHLVKQIAIVDPKLIVLLGNVAIKGALGQSSRLLSELHGQTERENGRKYFFTFHSSAARRFPKIRRLM